MVLKYKVPKAYRKKVYDGKKVIYCEVLQTQEIENSAIVIVKAKMLNLKNYINIFCNTDLKKLNFIDKIKLWFIK